MFNTTVTVKGDEVTITANLKQQGKPSSTGKSMVIASSEGNQVIAGAVVAGKPVYIGLNIYVKN